MPVMVGTRRVEFLGRRAVSAPSFSPSSLPGLQLLLDARTIAQADGSALTTWPDTSGKGNNGTGGSGLTYHSAGGPNGLPRVSANGANGSLSVALGLSTPHTIYALVTPGAAAGYKRLLSGVADDYLFLGVSGTNQLTALFGNGSAWNYVNDWSLAPQQAAGVYSVISQIHDGVTASAWYNGSPQGGELATMAAASGISLFGPPSTNQWWDGSLCLLAVYDRVHTEAQRLQMEAYLSTLSAVTVASISRMALTRYAGNPIIAKTLPCESSDIANPDVTWDTPNSRWMMNYSAYDGSDWRLCLAYSTDLLTWAKDANNPVASPVTGEGTLCCNGTVLWMPGVSLYYHWYETSSNDGIYLMTSPDRVTWTRQGKVLALGTAGTYDSTFIADMCVRWMPGGTTTLECWYRAIDGSGNNTNARATSTDGIAWTRDKAYFGAQPWASVNFGEPSILRDSSEPSILRVSFDVATVDGHRNIGEAWSPDGGTTWGFQSNFQEPGTAAWEVGECFDSCLLVDGGTLYLFYAGASGFGGTTGMDSQIGVATATYDAEAF